MLFLLTVTFYIKVVYKPTKEMSEAKAISLPNKELKEKRNKYLGNWEMKSQSMVKKLNRSKLKYSMALLTPDPFYDWNKVKETPWQDTIGNKNNSAKLLANSPKFNSGPAWRHMLKGLELAVLPSRRLLIDGRKIDGIIFPRKKSLHWLILREIVRWFLPCLEQDDKKAGKLNETCFVFKQNQLLNMFLKSQNFYSKLYFSIYKLTNF